MSNLADKTAYKVLFIIAEMVKEFEKLHYLDMADYEKRLRAIRHSEKDIQQLINKKIKLNYGND